MCAVLRALSAHDVSLADARAAAACFLPLTAASGHVTGAHTDYTGFTILRQDPSVSGLEAQTRDGEWHAVPPRPGGFVVNAGDLIQVWTNDRWRSPPHRVVNPPPGLARKGRLSLVFFTGPADETVIEALPGTFGEGRPKRYEPVSARGHLLKKLGLSNTDDSKAAG